MEEKKAFCEVCRDEVEYLVIKENLISNIKGKEYKYIGKKAICPKCKEEIFVNKIIDENLEKLYKEIRKANNIISLEEINEIPKKYKIGKRPISILLGWGEQTFSRYCEGDIPTKQYSEIMTRILNSPKEYLEILEKNREQIKEVTYRKSMEATKEIINGVSKNKLNIVTEYLIKECEDVTQLALQKMLYYVQGFSYCFLGNFMFEEDCEAWVHGPVYRDIYIKYKEYRYDPIKIHNEEKVLELDFSEKVIIDSIIKSFGCYSGKVLERFTHEEKPWREARSDLREEEPSEKIIKKELIGTYFEEIKEKNKMINPIDISDYSKKMFSKIVI
ncbi:MAG: type II TA system antitoxin MqsA family protein [Clostridium sp.]